MEERYTDPTPRPPRRRRRKSKLQIFKEDSLPVLIGAVSVVLIIIFIAGSVTRNMAYRQAAQEESQAAYESSVAEAARLQQEADALVAQADALAQEYDYLAAVKVLDTFHGERDSFPVLAARYTEYAAQAEASVTWSDPAQYGVLAFHPLMADPAKALADSTYGGIFNRDYTTCNEFRAILQQLYDNGYMLVSYRDLLRTEGDTVTFQGLTLPQGKKPLLLIQTNVNYYRYTAGCGGFANRLALDGLGQLTAEMTDGEGQTVQGEFDLVPILESFLESHPDFSFKGARAVLAVSGYEGVFGYRVDRDSQAALTEEEYQAQLQGATAVAHALNTAGYEFACYTYATDYFSGFTATEVQADLAGWTNEIGSILGSTSIFVCPNGCDVTGEMDSGSEKVTVLRENGYRCFIGTAKEGAFWSTAGTNYFCQGRLLVSGANMAHNGQWFQSFFTPSQVLEESRGDIPQ